MRKLFSPFNILFCGVNLLDGMQCPLRLSQSESITDRTLFALARCTGMEGTPDKMTQEERAIYQGSLLENFAMKQKLAERDAQLKAISDVLTGSNGNEVMVAHYQVNKIRVIVNGMDAQPTHDNTDAYPKTPNPFFCTIQYSHERGWGRICEYCISRGILCVYTPKERTEFEEHRKRVEESIARGRDY